MNVCTYVCVCHMHRYTYHMTTVYICLCVLCYCVLSSLYVLHTELYRYDTYTMPISCNRYTHMHAHEHVHHMPVFKNCVLCA